LESQGSTERFGFESGGMLGAMAWHLSANSMPFSRELLRTMTKAPGTGEEAINGPCGEDVAFADLAGPVEDGDAGGVVLEDRDLVGAELNWHRPRCARVQPFGKDEMLTGNQ
jgi:hypothetical protein